MRDTFPLLIKTDFPAIRRRQLDTLQANLDLFRGSGRFYRDNEEFFAMQSWIQVMLGQRLMPRNYHPFVDQMPEEEVVKFVDHVRTVIAGCVDAMPTHQAFIDRYCKAPALT